MKNENTGAARPVTPPTELTSETNPVEAGGRARSPSSISKNEEQTKTMHTLGPLGTKKAPKSATTGILFARNDHGTAHFVTYNNGVHKGEIACCFGEHAQGNATLFSAAPDLLTACRAMVSHDKNGRFGDPSFPAAIEALRAAISKAEGLSQ